MNIQFTVYQIPKPKLESKSRAIKRRKKNGEIGTTTMQYKATKQKKNEMKIMGILDLHKPEIPLDVALMLTVQAFLPMPKYIYSTWRREPAEAGIIRPPVKPDLSNLIKFIEDCMKQSGYFRDDSLIVQYGDNIGKWYSVNPRWEIKLTEIWQPRTKKEYDAFRAEYGNENRALRHR